MSVAALAATPDVSRLDELTRSMVARGHFQGVVLVAQGDRVLLERGYGPASADGREFNDPRRCYWLASVSKQFTSAAVLRFVDEGRLRLDDPLRMHLPDTPSAWSAITVRELLSHTAGVPNYTEAPDYPALKAQAVTPQALWERFKHLPLDFEPGTAMHYSNSGYAVLGLLIEALGGRSYGATLQAEFFGPLGMRHTGAMGFASARPDCAQGLVLDGTTFHAADVIDPSVTYGAGNLYSTTRDLLRWQRALYGGHVLKPASREAMTTPVRDGYALGLAVERVDGRRRYAHGGGIDGFSTYLLYEPQGAVTVAVLGNDQGAASQALANKLARVARGHYVPLPNERRSVKVAPALLAGLVGTYGLASGETAWVLQRGDEIWARVGALPWMHVEPESSNTFYSREHDLEWRFERKGARSGTGSAHALLLPDLSGSRRWVRSPAPALDVANQTVYFRGTMNAWDQSLAMTKESDGLLHLSLLLPAGTHSFKLATADWATLDWGRTASSGSLPAVGKLPLVHAGNNIELTLTELARCTFTLDGRDIVAPSLAWACLGGDS